MIEHWTFHNVSAQYSQLSTKSQAGHLRGWWHIGGSVLFSEIDSIGTQQQQCPGVLVFFFFCWYDKISWPKVPYVRKSWFWLMVLEGEGSIMAGKAGQQTATGESWEITFSTANMTLRPKLGSRARLWILKAYSLHSLLPSASLHLLNLSKWCHQLGANNLNTLILGRCFSFKLPY